MQISNRFSGVGTVSEHHLEVHGFESRGCLVLLCLFSKSTGNGVHDVIIRFRKSQLGYANT